MTDISVSPYKEEAEPFKITVISDADAIFRVERIELSDAAVRSLTTSAAKLEAASVPSPSDSGDRPALMQKP